MDNMRKLMTVFFAFLYFMFGQSIKDFPYKKDYFNAYIDNFNRMVFGTYQMKYLYQDKHWKPESGSIFVYAGNEGPIEGFWTASGFVHEIAQQFDALVLFPEHRYYGESLPFGDQSFEVPLIGLLNIEQVMADYVTFISAMKVKYNATNAKVIAFGGSYGGMLAAYMRFKYPNIIDGALAASAPIYMQDLKGPHDFFFKHVTQDFQKESKECYETVKSAFKIMNDLARIGQPGLDKISDAFSLCKPLTDMTRYRHLQGWVRNAFTFIAMLDYPYATGFMGGLPGHPVKAACKKILSSKSSMIGLAQASGLFYNSSVSCFDIDTEFVECADPTGCGTGPAAKAWDYQACTDIILPAGSNNVSDMFPVLPWNLQLRTEYCKKTFGITPRNSWPGIQFWGEKIKSTSNIIFSNGDLDPWMGGGVLTDVSDSIVAVLVKGGAHHLDLRASNPADPPGVVEAREKEKGIIRKWINKH